MQTVLVSFTETHVLLCHILTQILIIQILNVSEFIKAFAGYSFLHRSVRQGLYLFML